MLEFAHHLGVIGVKSCLLSHRQIAAIELYKNNIDEVNSTDLIKVQFEFKSNQRIKAPLMHSLQLMPLSAFHHRSVPPGSPWQRMLQP